MEEEKQTEKWYHDGNCTAAIGACLGKCDCKLGEIKWLNERLASLTSQLREKEQQVADCRAKIDSYDAQLISAKLELRDSQKRVGELEEELTFDNATLLLGEAEIEKALKRVSELEGALKSCDPWQRVADGWECMFCRKRDEVWSADSKHNEGCMWEQIQFLPPSEEQPVSGEVKL